ncbi:MAG: bifunctional glutamate N-acetyltransferase/amino-acid acetyltransferase ArgJ [Atopobiaceae bacterium]|nr:bifunctional glutamate N-acetyltransferase/amino-acid acetyltransferase ArgJ [Atopobiaceae bacterium]
MTEYKPIELPFESDPALLVGFSSCEGGVCAARGIQAQGVQAGFRHNPERLDLALVVAQNSCPVAATFTQNRFCAAPVQLSKTRLEDGFARAVVLNSGNANAATGEQGLISATKSCQIVAHELGCPENEVLIASTGVIGVQLPTEGFERGIPVAAATLEASAEAAHNAACAVMTTDTYPKEAALVGTLVLDGAQGLQETLIHIGGFVKGSGMISPNMATMLAVLSTDAPLTHKAATAALRRAVNASFNKVTVDSDTSTNDSCFLFATGAAYPEATPITEEHPAFDAFSAALESVCQMLARQIAADGEGATKLVTVDVVNALNEDDAERVAFSIANSPLVKTAIFGHDANWGRVAAAAGKCGVAFDQSQVDIDLLGVPVCRAGLAIEMDEDDMLKRFEQDELSIAISLGMGSAHARVWTCDLTHEYVTINGDYRT